MSLLRSGFSNQLPHNKMRLNPLWVPPCFLSPFSSCQPWSSSAASPIFSTAPPLLSTVSISVSQDLADFLPSAGGSAHGSESFCSPLPGCVAFSVCTLPGRRRGVVQAAGALLAAVLPARTASLFCPSLFLLSSRSLA